MLKCSKEAFAACPDRHLCGCVEEATFTEGSECDEFNRQIGSHTMTNGDQIRAMSDEELTDKLHQLYLIFSDEGYYDFGRLFCDGKDGCIDADGEVQCNDERREDLFPELRLPVVPCWEVRRELEIVTLRADCRYEPSLRMEGSVKSRLASALAEEAVRSQLVEFTCRMEKDSLGPVVVVRAQIKIVKPE